MQVIKGRVSCSCVDHTVMLHGTLVVPAAVVGSSPDQGIGELVGSAVHSPLNPCVQQ